MLSSLPILLLSFLLLYSMYKMDKERALFIETIKELSILLKSDTVQKFAEYQEKDVEIQPEEEDDDYSSYVSISDASPDELRDATINLTPLQR